MTAGIASGPGSPERSILLGSLGGPAWTHSDYWQDIHFNPGTPIHSSLVVSAVDGQKQQSVTSMVSWWRSAQKVPIKDENVHFFDDIQGNVQAFASTGYNAHQVSCAQPRGPKENIPGSYDGKIGGCGGTIMEAVGDKGIQTCA